MTEISAGSRSLPLTYSTNVHPGRNLDEVLEQLGVHATRVREIVSPRSEFAVGLWLSASTIEPILRDPTEEERLHRFLEKNHLRVYTLNAFPYGDFHADRVKRAVYRPSWSDLDRIEYTEGAARVLARLLPEGATGSISTLAGGGRADGDSEHDRRRIAANLRRIDRFLAELESETGRRILLALEPEPLTTLETTDDALLFFGAHLEGTTHLGLCLDVCHQAVLFENLADSLERLSASGIPIAKVQLSCALEVIEPSRSPEAIEALERLAEDRYLHQTYARFDSGRIEGVDDLPQLFPTAPSGWMSARSWRTHYHVPVFAETLGALSTTREDLETALTWIRSHPDRIHHLEIETYTWEVLPDSERARLAPDLASGIAAEFEWVRSQLG